MLIIALLLLHYNRVVAGGGVAPSRTPPELSYLLVGLHSVDLWNLIGHVHNGDIDRNRQLLLKAL